MPYCTRQQLIDRYGETEIKQLTDRANLCVIDDVVLNQAIADADAEIDGYLREKHTLPITVISNTLELIASEITRFYLYDKSATDEVRNRYEHAIATLKSYVAGKTDLGLPDDTVANASGGVAFVKTDRIFDSKTLANF